MKMQKSKDPSFIILLLKRYLRKGTLRHSNRIWNNPCLSSLGSPER